MIENAFTIRQIETFYFTAKYLSITQAAKKLYLSAPAVWKHIHNLELLYNKRFFHKEGKQLALTKAGHLLYNQAAIFLNARSNLAKALLEVSDENQPIVLSITNTFQSIAFKLIQPFINTFPNIKVEFTLDRWTDQEALLASNNHDFYIISDPQNIPETYTQKTLLTYNYVLVASNDNPVSHIKNLKAQDIIHSNYLVTKARSIAQKHHQHIYQKWGMTGKPIYVDSFLAAKEAVSANIGIAMLPECIIQDELDNNKLTQLSIPLEMPTSYLLLVYKNSELEPGNHELFFNFL